MTSSLTTTEIAELMAHAETCDNMRMEQLPPVLQAVRDAMSQPGISMQDHAKLKELEHRIAMNMWAIA